MKNPEAMDDAGAHPIRFESFRLDPCSRELRTADGEVVPLTSKAFDTLWYLVAHRDRVIGKDELLGAVWPGRVVEENNLSQAVSAIRRALGTEPREHRYLVTIPGRGYRFVAPVHAVGDGMDNVPGLQAPGVAVPAPGAGERPGAQAPVGVHAGAGPGRATWLGALLFLFALLAVGAWHMLGSAPVRIGAGASAPAAPAALAVLPFRPLTPGPQDALLELGLADTLVTRLGRSPGVRVRALSSSGSFQGASDPSAAGRALGADFVVEGSIQRTGRRLRVNARLVAVQDGRVLWSDTFDTVDEEVFTLQDRIAGSITGALSLNPPAVSARPASPCDGADARAYRAVLLAQYRLHRRDPRTIPAFHDAIRIDPTCTRAYAGLAVAYMFMAHNDAPPGEVFPLARAAIDRALGLDPGSPEALMAHGRFLQLHRWDWRGSEAALRKAIALNPSLPEAHLGLAHLLVTTGRFDEGLAAARRARELDPLSPFLNALEAGFLTAAGRPEAARARLQRALELEPGFWVALLVRGGMALDRGEVEAAIEDLEQAARGSRRTSQVLAVLALARAASGDRARVDELLRELDARAARTYVPATSRAAVLLARGDTESALRHLEHARDARDIRTVFIGVDARWNPLRREPRFRALAGQLDLPAEHATGRF